MQFQIGVFFYTKLPKKMNFSQREQNNLERKMNIELFKTTSYQALSQIHDRLFTFSNEFHWNIQMKTLKLDQRIIQFNGSVLFQNFISMAVDAIS